MSESPSSQPGSSESPLSPPLTSPPAPEAVSSEPGAAEASSTLLRSSETRCRRCGVPTHSTSNFCSYCGARPQAQQTVISIIRILGAVVLAITAIILGLAGACFLLISPSMTGGSSDSSGALTFFLIGLGLVLTAASCIYAFIKVIR